MARKNRVTNHLSFVESHEPFRGRTFRYPGMDGRSGPCTTGSPFAPVKYGGQSIEIAQCNNVFIFPAVGLGLFASQARRVTDKMILAGAKALGDHSPALRDPAASLLPRVRTIREVALEIAYAVALKAQEEGGFVIDSA